MKIISFKKYYPKEFMKQKTEIDYPFKNKPNFSPLKSIIESSSQGPIISFMFDDSIGDLLWLKPKILHEEYNISNYPVDILSFDKIFLECDMAQAVIYKVK